MKSLKDCEFTAFISYAQADDAAWYDWVTQLRNELELSLGAMLRGVRLPRFHLSGENGPVTGVLSDEVRHRVEASFAMIIVVHDNYAHSDLCLKELEYFSSLLGPNSFRERLFVIAMSEPAMLQVSRSPAWRRLVPYDEQIWMPFFDPTDKARPLDIYMAPGLLSHGFRQPFERLRSDFAAMLRRYIATTRLSSPTPTTQLAPVVPTQPGPQSHPGTVIFVSHATEDLTWAEDVVQALEHAGYSCWLAARDIMPGAPAYGAEITKAIKRSRLMVALISEHASGSAHCAREVTMAFDRGLPVVPLKLDIKPLGDALEYFFATAQVLMTDGKPRDTVLGALIRAVRPLVPG